MTGVNAAMAVTTGRFIVAGGPTSAYSGFANGGGVPTVTIGSLIGPSTDPVSGYTIDAIAEALTVGIYSDYFSVEGNHTGTWWTTITVGGIALSRTAAEVATGSYDSGTDSTYWVWLLGEGPGQWNLSAGTNYAYTIV